MPAPHGRRSAQALSDAGGHGCIARVGLASAAVGQLIAVTEVVRPSNRDLGNVLLSLPILTAGGLANAGFAAGSLPGRLT
ncbi:hypothetical protein GA0070604_3988 [Micromonospora eburnea]|uniref:Uncharacterized protein n=1 Tax=Micromonospora eburnea TaxID=227316 RepID=A0A1C6UZ59_9ACTN|nr:hypothetical protein GA0070604_3988 [Micromonospora eburnea]